MGSTRVNLPSAPPPPAPVNPGESIDSYIRSITNPEIQQRLLEAERTYRPEYTALELADINTMLLGGAGQRGLLDLNEEAVRRQQTLGAEAASAQRAADIADVEALGGRASAAFLAANPQLAAQLQQAQALGGSQDLYGPLAGAIQAPTREDVTAGSVSAGNIGQGLLGQSLYNQALNAQIESGVTSALRGQAERLAGSTGALTPLEQRAVEQQTRAASAARGRYGDTSSVAAEVGNRIAAQRGRQQEDIAAALGINQQLLGQQQSQQAFAQGVYGQDLGRQQQNVANQLQAGMFNTGLATDVASQNRAFANQQQQQYLQNLGLLGQARQQQLAQDRAYALQLAGQYGVYASDPFQAILGRPSQALSAGAQQQGLAAQLAGQPVGPQLFDPNAGVNLALQNNANLANYNASIYGAQAAAQGAAAQGRGSALGGLFGGVGSLLGGIF